MAGNIPGQSVKGIIHGISVPFREWTMYQSVSWLQTAETDSGSHKQNEDLLEECWIESALKLKP